LCAAAHRHPAQWKPLGGENPSLLILGLLAATRACLYFLLSTTSRSCKRGLPEFSGKSPYRLFALSNLASMLALLGYPFALSPGDDAPAVVTAGRAHTSRSLC
jgi:hypothetical protein